MCGICGVMSLGSTRTEPRNGLIERMTATLVHRGPNDRGIWYDERIALGHRRLSVIDLSEAGRQPMSNEDGSIQIVYNGEIYNFRELKTNYALSERGHVFRSRTDTEVLIHLYESVGFEKMLSELNGMFAFAIWDSRKKLLYLTRDRYGVKPLFYQQDDRCFRFASEIKAIIADDRVARKPSLQALHDFLSFDYVPGRQTAFDGIHELPPGHWASVDTAGHVKMEQYCEMSFQQNNEIDEPMAVNRARELLMQSVERQLVADVPIGVLLSGGMDSSTLVGLMKRCVSEPVHTYSVGFEDPSFNELPYARSVSNDFKTIHREVTVTSDLVRELLPKYLTYFDEPYGDGSAIPTYYVCQLAKDDVVVVLSGEGGDEVFAGYETYAAYQVNRWFRKVPRWMRRNLVFPLVNCLPVSDKKLSLEFKLKRFLGGQDLSPAQAHLWWRIVLTEAQKLSLYTPSVLEEIMPQPSERHFIDRFEKSAAKDALSRLFEIDCSVFLPDDLMVKNDRMSMAHSLEARVPFTDLELTAFMSTVPSGLKLPSLRKKHVMREAMKGILPAKILNRKKVGLEMPYSHWLKHDLKDLMMCYLGPARISNTGLFRVEAVQTLVTDHLAGRVDHGRALWGLINYMMWLELYIPRF
ncbi:MAG: asparagine synthase (glutamine-hydrolyzing) [Deltaproteobacteria bacterium]|nr:asparagine synthase (glutamine-hydrolyzing) [Deltaproteobacteria bacterium]